MSIGKLLRVLGAVTCLLTVTIPVQAITLGVSANPQTISVGSTVEVSLDISGLGFFTTPSLGTFDVDITYDSAILGLDGVVFGDPVLGDQLDLFGFGSITEMITGVGVVNLFELSFDLPFDLDDFQADAFTLATLTFRGLALGESAMGVASSTLGDSLGDPLDADTLGTRITVEGDTAPVPEPSIMAMLGMGFIALIANVTRRRKTYR